MKFKITLAYVQANNAAQQTRISTSNMSAEKSFAKSMSKLKMPNSIKVSSDSRITSKEAFEVAKMVMPTTVSEQDRGNMIMTVAPITDKCWIAVVSETVDVGKITQRSVAYNSKTFSIEAGNNTFEAPPKFFSKVLRVHWLAPRLDLELVNKMIIGDHKDLIDYSICTHEHYRDESMSHVENGVYRVRIRYLATKDDLVRRVLLGKRQIGADRVLVLMAGEPPVCFFCQQTGHFKVNCPRMKMQCSKCNKIGHVAETCSFANRVSYDDVDKERVDQVDEEQSSVESALTNLSQNIAETTIVQQTLVQKKKTTSSPKLVRSTLHSDNTIYHPRTYTQKRAAETSSNESSPAGYGNKQVKKKSANEENSEQFDAQDLSKSYVSYTDDDTCENNSECMSESENEKSIVVSNHDMRDDNLIDVSTLIKEVHNERNMEKNN